MITKTWTTFGVAYVVQVDECGAASVFSLFIMNWEEGYEYRDTSIQNGTQALCKTRIFSSN